MYSNTVNILIPFLFSIQFAKVTQLLVQLLVLQLLDVVFSSSVLQVIEALRGILLMILFPVEGHTVCVVVVHLEARPIGGLLRLNGILLVASKGHWNIALVVCLANLDRIRISDDLLVGRKVGLELRGLEGLWLRLVESGRVWLELGSDLLRGSLLNLGSTSEKVFKEAILLRGWFRSSNFNLGLHIRVLTI
jgi:hypothetical protein